MKKSVLLIEKKPQESSYSSWNTKSLLKTKCNMYKETKDEFDLSTSSGL